LTLTALNELLVFVSDRRADNKMKDMAHMLSKTAITDWKNKVTTALVDVHFEHCDT